MTDKKTKGQILTVNAKGLFIDGKPTTTYNGATIEKAADFAKLLVEDFVEVEIMQSDLSSRHGESGNPTPDYMGLYTWMRVKIKVGKREIWSDWLRDGEYTGFPIVAKEPFQSNQDQMRQRLKQRILADAFVLASAKRPEFREALLENLQPKRGVWRTAKELATYVDVVSMDMDSDDFHVDGLDKTVELINEKLKKFHDKYATKYPNAVKVEDAGKNRKSYSLNLKYIQLFCKASNFTLIIPLKTKDWKNVRELALHYIDADPEIISAALNKLTTSLFESIQALTNPETGEHELCLNIAGIQKFCEKTHLKPKANRIGVYKQGQKVAGALDEAKKAITPKSDGRSM